MPASLISASSRCGRFIALAMLISELCSTFSFSEICASCTFIFCGIYSPLIYVHFTLNRIIMPNVTTTTTEVLICGAGACGLSLALLLPRAGVPFRLIEKMEAPFQGSRGKGIQPRTLEIFEDLEVLSQMQAAGSPYPVQRVYSSDGSYQESPV